MVRICFVCLGNICRSPTAEGIFRHLVSARGLEADFEIESAGTGDWHVGEPPDSRTAAVARTRGIELEGRAQQFTRSSFARFDRVVAMDRANRDTLLTLARSEADRRKVALLRDFDPSSPEGADVPDPYYGGPDGFDRVFAICEAACASLLDALCRAHGLR